MTTTAKFTENTLISNYGFVGMCRYFRLLISRMQYASEYEMCPVSVNKKRMEWTERLLPIYIRVYWPYAHRVDYRFVHPHRECILIKCTVTRLRSFWFVSSFGGLSHFLRSAQAHMHSYSKCTVNIRFRWTIAISSMCMLLLSKCAVQSKHESCRIPLCTSSVCTILFRKRM